MKRQSLTNLFSCSSNSEILLSRCDTLEMDESQEQEVEIMEVERDGALGMLKRLLNRKNM